MPLQIHVFTMLQILGYISLYHPLLILHLQGHHST